MPEKREGNSHTKEVITHLHRVTSYGEVSSIDKRHGGIHGTSIEAITHIIQNGVLPGRNPIDREMHYEPGDISFFPTYMLRPVAERVKLRFSRGPTVMIDDVRGYAKLISTEHGLLTRFGYQVGNPDGVRAVKDLIWYEERDRLRNHGNTDAQIDNVLKEVSTLKGFLLGFSPDIQNAPGLEFTKGDPEEGDINIRTNARGLSYRYISGIQPLGPIEKDFLDSLM